MNDRKINRFQSKIDQFSRQLKLLARNIWWLVQLVEIIKMEKKKNHKNEKPETHRKIEIYMQILQKQNRKNKSNFSKNNKIATRSKTMGTNYKRDERKKNV